MNGPVRKASPIEVGEELRWKEARPGIPAIPFPSRAIHRAAGTEKTAALIRRMHERMRASEIGHYFPVSDRAFDALITRQAAYFIESTGGPADFTARFGKPSMGTFHRRVAVDIDARKVWLRSLWLAFADVDYPETAREEFWNWVEPFSILVMNRHEDPTKKPRRYPYAEVAAADPALVFA